MAAAFAKMEILRLKLSSQSAGLRRDQTGQCFSNTNYTHTTLMFFFIIFKPKENTMSFFKKELTFFSHVNKNVLESQYACVWVCACSVAQFCLTL